MSKTVIKVENLSKQYRLGNIGTGTLRSDFQRWWCNMVGKEDPTLKVGSENTLNSSNQKSDYVWALRDINFEVKQGEVLGIIGKNGAGKSTLLKILSQVTTPSTGNVKVKGRVASLLEVGTGFHPDLTGRENIFLNGAILGMTKTEIRSKFDEIVDFAGIAKYIDTPVKRYSSGMYVRLAFAVAAHLEPEILIVDEVLAVGDAEFQKKALGKMQDVSRGQGRTVLFVSHNMTAIKNLCKKVYGLANGICFFEGDVNKGINNYLQRGLSEVMIEKIYDVNDYSSGNDKIRLNRIKVEPLIGEEINIDSGIKLSIDFNNYLSNKNLDCTIEICTIDDLIIFHQGALISTNNDSIVANYIVEGFVKSNILNSGVYKINIIFGENQRYALFKQNDIFSFEVMNTITGQGANFHKMPGVIRPDLNWKITKHELQY